MPASNGWFRRQPQRDGGNGESARSLFSHGFAFSTAGECVVGMVLSQTSHQENRRYVHTVSLIHHTASLPGAWLQALYEKGTCLSMETIIRTAH